MIFKNILTLNQVRLPEWGRGHIEYIVVIYLMRISIFNHPRSAIYWVIIFRQDNRPLKRAAWGAFKSSYA